MVIFYNKSDKTMEPIGKIKSDVSIKEASEYFAKIKNLALKDFLRLFIVEHRIIREIKT